MKFSKNTVEKWSCFEIRFEAKIAGNPFLDVLLECEFSQGANTIRVEGFYDGGDTYVVRFMPTSEGRWTFRTSCSVRELNLKEGSFECVAPGSGNHGPVRVSRSTNFEYADGSPYFPVGTTCYVWSHQGDELEERTLDTLRTSPFNKMRMCVFPKRYRYNYNEPEFYPFEGRLTGTWDISMRDDYSHKPKAEWDFDRFNPEFFRHLEKRIGDLLELGIEADLILFHGYDFGAWGFDKMPRGVNERYLKYIVARLAAYRNIWWSLANEYDLMPAISMEDWHAYFRLVQEKDPYDHLRSIHNCRGFYDHSLSWVTHCSVQSGELDKIENHIQRYWKPVVYDECCYEGDIEMRWGDITAEEMVHRFWLGFSRGGYVGHGETYVSPDDVLWWAKGGVLHGTSPERIAFLRRFFEESGLQGLKPVLQSDRSFMLGGHDGMSHRGDECYLVYFGYRQPAKRVFEMGSMKYQVDVIDTWNMTVEALGVFSGTCEVALPKKPCIALKLIRVT